MVAADQRPDAKKYLVMLVCPYRLVREGLGFLLSQEEDLHLVGLMADASEALASLSRSQPDVVILVSAVGHQDCADVIRQFKTTCPNRPVLIISADIQPEHIQAALVAGATGYLPLDISQDELIRAVYTVCRGELILHPTVMLGLLSHLADQPAEDIKPNLDDFSSREREVLACLARGLSDRDIARALFISVRTVQTHLVHIYAKLGVHSRIEAALVAIRAGWFPRPNAGRVDDVIQ